MKTAGIIGGTGPESTVDYYRQIISLYRERNLDGNYPAIIINSINMKAMLDLVAANKLAELTDFLAEEVQRLARAGAAFGLLAANTSHIVFDALQTRSPIPLISIIETACRAAAAQGLKRIALFGTRFTMQGRFYPDVFERAGITLVLPTAAEQDYIHDKYMNELISGIVLPKTREGLIKITRRMEAHEGIDGLVLGGTELSLILTDSDIPTANGAIPVLDTTKLHVEQAVTLMLS